MNSSKNIVKKQEKKKESILEKKRFWYKVQKNLNRIELIFPIVGVVICFCGFIYLFRFQDDNIIGGILDFSIAMLSLFVLLFSVINDKLSDKTKYIFMNSLYIFLTLVGFVIVLILGMMLENPSTIGRALSFICLFASLILEIKKVLHYIHDRNLEQEKEKQEEINNIEKSSIMSSQE